MLMTPVLLMTALAAVAVMELVAAPMVMVPAFDTAVPVPLQQSVRVALKVRVALASVMARAANATGESIEGYGIGASAAECGGVGSAWHCAGRPIGGCVPSTLVGLAAGPPGPFQLFATSTPA